VRGFGRVVLLVGLWLLAWGDVSLANVVSGLAVAVALLAAFPPAGRSTTGPALRLRPWGALRLLVHVGTQLVTANVVMAREIVRPRPTLQPGVLEHRLQEPSEEIVTIMTSVIALSPGTMTVDVDEASSTIAVHFLFLRDVAESRAVLDHLEHLVRAAVTPGRRAEEPR
jgi:multicomponent Na+:H+ antiporter subunit E